MSAEFSANLSLLRKAKNISQKDAAEALGISQALLSHYEKGIRECSLDFVKKAASFYGVSSDYLLGLSDTKHAFHELLSNDEIRSDSAINPKTLIRCILYLSGVAERNGDAEQIFFDDYFSLCIRKYLAIIRPDDKLTAHFCDMLSAVITAERSEHPAAVPELTDAPLTLQTVTQHCAMMFGKKTEEIM